MSRWSAGAEPCIADVAELALWYHDAVYEPQKHDCEERSAELLSEDAASMISRDRALAAAACIRATAYLADVEPSGPAAELVVDVDRSILGRDPIRFMEFEYGVAEEYASTPSTRYFLERGRFLAALLASPSVFHTSCFRERFEARARANLAALLSSRRYRTHRLFGRIYRRLA
jgi:predicted metal-dependent HD superfamily phosphohydrolase